jgi:hypothetical protein
MTSDRYLKQRTDDPSGLGIDAQWIFSLVPEQLHRAPLSTTLVIQHMLCKHRASQATYLVD